MKTPFIDLHTHTVNSDGSMTAAELVRHAKAAGLRAIAITDHDSIDGVNEAVEEGKKIGLEVVPGIELSADSDTETHILGLYIDIQNPALKEALRGALISRQERMAATSDLLKQLGFDVPIEEVKALAPGGIVGRAHHAKLMVEKGYVSSVKEAFDKYLAFGKPAYNNRQKLTDRECVELIRECGGFSFLAHPHLTKKPDDVLIEFVKELKSYGLCGIEGYYSEYTQEQQGKYQKLAFDLELKICGGTDFHAAMKPHIKIGVGYGNMHIPYSVLEKIRN